jgi:two-component sensor histidine kinase
MTGSDQATDRLSGSPAHMSSVGITERVADERMDQLLGQRDELRGRAQHFEALARLGERALFEPEIETLLSDVADTVAAILTTEFVAVLELMPGDTGLLLRAGRGFPCRPGGTPVTPAAETDRPDFIRLVLNAGTPVVTDDFSSETRFSIPHLLLDHGCISGISTAIAGHGGRTYGILCAASAGRRAFAMQDATLLTAVASLVAGAIERFQREQRYQLMIRELRHRSGNLFAQLLALLSQTAKNSRSMAELTSKYQARVLALADAHRLITEAGWNTTSLADLVRSVLGPYLERAVFDGPDVEIAPDPTFSLSAALHELMANAVMHGSLSRPEGQLDLRWSAATTPAGQTLTFDWIERNGPPARRPRRAGFGSRLIGIVIERQLSGQVLPSYSRDGFSMRLIVPLTNERWPLADGDGRDAPRPPGA